MTRAMIVIEDMINHVNRRGRGLTDWESKFMSSNAHGQRGTSHVMTPQRALVTIDLVDLMSSVLAAVRGRSSPHAVTYRLSVEPLPAGNVVLIAAVTIPKGKSHGGNSKMPAYKASVDGTYRVKFAGTDAHGHAAPTETVTFSAVNPALVGIVQDNNADGSWSAILTPTGTLGVTQIQVNADGKIGPGEIPILVLGDIEFVAGDAVTGTVTFEKLT